MKLDADGWRRCEIGRAELKPLLQRSDKAGLLNLSVFVLPLVATAWAAIFWQGTAAGIAALWAYGSIYGFCNSLLHETHHATPFRTRWINELVHKFAGLMAVRNPVYDRWIHTQHHSQTSRDGLDPELAHPAPIKVWALVADLFWLRAAVNNPILLWRQAFGQMPRDGQKFIPVSEWPKVRQAARAMLAFYGTIILVSVVYQTWWPLLFTYLAHIYGGLVPRAYSLTQHIGLDQNKDDFRLTTRTCLYNPVIGAWYWNMQYHIEHHMYPLVPFHQLPALHDAVKHELPAPSRGVIGAWREIISCIRRQQREPGYVLNPSLPSYSAPGA